MLTTSILSSWAQKGSVTGQWPSYGGDLGSTKYSSLSQINAETLKDLKIAWEWSSPENKRVSGSPTNPFLRTIRYEATPLMVDGTLYTSSSHCDVIAIDCETGKTIWSYDPETWKIGRPTNLGFVHRGVAYWADGEDKRILIATGDSQLIAVNAKTGKPIETFGEKGRVDLTQGLRRRVSKRLYAVTSPPVVCRDVVVVGSSIMDGAAFKKSPPGDVRGFDVRTGKTLWTFQSIPQAGEFGNETWRDNSWEYTGNANVWTLMSADEELGYVYLPFGTPTNDFYGGHRPGDGLFGESLVCVNAKTGERVWHFQSTHHGVWDYDLCAAPALVDITVDGKRIKALAQTTKQGFCWVLDRTTGKPVWPIEERPVPQSKVPGEQTSPTQPFPTRPAPFEQQGVTEDDLIDFTPELRAGALKALKEFDYGPLYTPPSTEKPTILMPSWGGGGDWFGCAFDPETSILYIPSYRWANAVQLIQPPNPALSDLKYRGNVVEALPYPQGLPLWKPPYGHLNAVDLSTGETLWKATIGDGPRDHPLLKHLNLPPLGNTGYPFVLVTKTLVFIAQAADAKNVYAFDKASGKEIGRFSLPYKPGGAPMTYWSSGKQFIVFPVGGGAEPSELVAFAIATKSSK